MNKIKTFAIGTVALAAVFLAFKMNTHDAKNHVVEKPVVEHKTDPDYLKKSIRVVPDFPKKGIRFFDITTTLDDPKAFQVCMNRLEARYKGKHIDAIVGLESRGFIFGAALADRLKTAFALVRKPGKLPADKFKVEYKKEYGADIFELHKGSIKPGHKVVVIDDLIATGGTANAAIDLVKMAGGTVTEVAAIIEIPELKGREKIKAPVYTVLQLNEH
jgi:adenine phosphoribosyltransferase